MAGDSDMGAKVFYEMSAKLKRAGDGDLRKQLHKEVREGAKPVLPAVRRSAGSRFPARGGLAAHMAKGSRYRAVVKTGAATAGVSIRANKVDPRSDTQGRVAHPVPARGGEPMRDEKGRRVMVVQRFPGAVGYFREPIEAEAPAIRAHLIATLEQWAERFAG